MRQNKFNLGHIKVQNEGQLKDTENCKKNLSLNT